MPTPPILGDPLPGDLGKPILDRQRELAVGGAAPSDPAAAPRGMTAAEQAAKAERQRIAALAHQAREAGVMVQSSGRTAGASTVNGNEGAVMTSAAPVAEGGQTGRPALDPDHDQNAQQRKLDFIGQQSSSGIYNAHALQTPASPCQIMAGSVIAASVITGLNSDLPGMVMAQVTEPVFDTVTDRILLIPQGSRLIGSYDSVVAFGQSRALLAWQRSILPDGSFILIDNLPPPTRRTMQACPRRWTSIPGACSRESHFRPRLASEPNCRLAAMKRYCSRDPAIHPAVRQPDRSADRFQEPQHPAHHHRPSRLAASCDRSQGHSIAALGRRSLTRRCPVLKLANCPIVHRSRSASPSHRLGWHHIGDAWERTSHREPPREYLRVRIDDPFYPISAMLFPDAEGLTAHLVLPPSDRARKRQEEWAVNED